MAVEAARDALEGMDRSAIERVLIASTTLPFADRQNAGVVKEALNLRDDVAAMDVGGSQRAATSALLAALQGRETILAMAAETAIAKPASEREMISGDAAAAVRSEEHTSELQSLMRISYAVFCLKKKKTSKSII